MESFLHSTAGGAFFDGGVEEDDPDVHGILSCMDGLNFSGLQL